MQGFREWLIERGYSKRSIQDYLYAVRCCEGIEFKEYLNSASSIPIYNRRLRGLKAYFKYKEMELDLPFKRLPFKPKMLPSIEDIRRFYEAIRDIRVKAIFLLLITSGLRVGEILSLTDRDVDLERRMLIPNIHSGLTKRSWASFFNGEAYAVVKQVKEVKRKGFHFIPISEAYLKKVWSEARRQSGVNLKMKDLRVLFAVLMSERGVSPTYINAFAGRLPQSILERHYTDYSPERLKRIYDQAGLKIFTT